MLPVVREYLAQCSQRQVEPYHAFVEHAEEGAVIADLDFAPPSAVRLFSVALLRHGINKGAHHPPKQSKKLISYEAQFSRRLPENDVLARVNRPLVRNLVHGVRMACISSTQHLSRLELCGLPLCDGDNMMSATSRLFDVLSQCRALSVLKLNRSTLTDKLFEQLTITGRSSAFQMLKEAHFSECGLTDACARGLHSLVLLNGGRRQLTAWRSSLRGGGGPGCPTDVRGIEVLDLSGNYLSDLALQRLAAALTNNDSLRVVDISRNAITTSGLIGVLQQGVLEKSAVESFDFSKNLIDTCAVDGVVRGFICQRHYGQQLLLTREKASSHRIETRRVSDSMPKKPCKKQPVYGRSLRSMQTTPEAKKGFEIGNKVVTERDSAQEAFPGKGKPPVKPEVACTESQNSESSTSSLASHGGDLKERIVKQTKNWCEYVSSRSSFKGGRHSVTRSHRSNTSLTSNSTGTGSPTAAQPLFTTWGSARTIKPFYFTTTGRKQQQWCGMPLYVTLPVNPVGVVASSQAAVCKRDVAVGTSSVAECPRHNCSDGGNASSETMTASNSEPDGVSAFESKMIEPLQTGEFEIAEWRQKEARFLESLVVRLENHETSTAELVERNHQRTCEALAALKEELSLRIREVVEEQRAEREQLRETLSAEREVLEPDTALAGELVRLIQTGVRRIHDQMERPVVAPTAARGCAAGGGAAGSSVQDYLRDVRSALSGLGW
uniref:Leucine-rich repeat protein (LRRP) n=1 Tax=Trypanosoma vivax (strain Y486) TaxID=1055687 RepID=G0UCI2_TRYVY|nr:conserved hypothetical protein, fragment [Trypanosoma vivax Y486]